MAGEGNAQPTLGTETIFYSQEGLLLPKTKEKHKLRVPTFSEHTKKISEVLPTTISIFDKGANWLFEAHSTKITTQNDVWTGIDVTLGNIKFKGEFMYYYKCL